MVQIASTVTSPLARWSRRLGVFSVQLLLLAIALHRLASLPTPVALNIMLSALALAAGAVALALGSYVAIWRDGRAGAWAATTGLLLGLGLMAWPAALVPQYRSEPPIHDVTTDTSVPPAFVTLAATRPRTANALDYGGSQVATLQLAAYPDIRPVIVPHPVTETWELLGQTVRSLGWTVASETPPQGRGQPGYIEATDRTLIIGFYDDVIVRVDGGQRETRIDIRSVSRYGTHDFGRNAQRVRRFLKEFNTRLQASITGTDQPRGRRIRPQKAVPKRLKGAQALSSGQKQKQGRAQRGSRREPQ